MARKTHGLTSCSRPVHTVLCTWPEQNLYEEAWEAEAAHAESLPVLSEVSPSAENSCSGPAMD